MATMRPEALGPILRHETSVGSTLSAPAAPRPPRCAVARDGASSARHARLIRLRDEDNTFPPAMGTKISTPRRRPALSPLVPSSGPVRIEPLLTITASHK